MWRRFVNYRRNEKFKNDMTDFITNNSKSPRLIAVLLFNNQRRTLVVIAIGRDGNTEMVKRLIPYGIPMLVETPPAMNLNDLHSLWDTRRVSNCFLTK